MIIPAILEKSSLEVQKKVDRVRGLALRVQIDVIDGVFADNMTVGPLDVLDVDFSAIAVDIQLMVEEPVGFIDELVQLRERVSSLRIIGHVERMSNLEDFIKEGHRANCEVGLALDLFTPLSAVTSSIFDNLDCLLLMTVKAGSQGREVFNKNAVEKIRQAASEARRRALRAPIIADGGLDAKSVAVCARAGANDFAIGHYLWQHEDIRKTLRELEEAEN